MCDYTEENYPPVKKNPQGGPNIKPGGPFDYSAEMEEEKNRKEAMDRVDQGVDNPVRTIL